jgi:hypothetical protein
MQQCTNPSADAWIKFENLYQVTAIFMCQANLFKKRADLKSQRKFLDTPYVENIDILRKNLT